MDKTQNVTLAIPRDILRKARILAIQKNTSLSGLLTQTLVDIVINQDEFELARRRSLSLLEAGFDFGTHGQTTWKRDDLHER